MSAASAVTHGDDVQVCWGVLIPLQDSTELSATLYLPRNMRSARPAIITMTPYIAQTYHDIGMYFAGRGFPFLTIDVRGRGNSGGVFQPLRQEAADGAEMVDWVGKQSWCDGKVAMWGGSYAGYAQWATASRFPRHLTAIAPVASPYPAVDFPLVDNIAHSHMIQWLIHVSGRALQDRIYWNNAEWASRFRRFCEAGLAYKFLDEFVGYPSAIFQEWIHQSERPEYWASHNPTPADYGALALPILTITGQYDDDQRGALKHYRQHMLYGAPDCMARHHLVIGPWDHAGTRIPKGDFGGMTFGTESLIDLNRLHLEWYEWVMGDGQKPDFLKERVAYYVIGEEGWRYADSLEAVTARHEPLYLDSTANPDDIFKAGQLTTAPPRNSVPDHYSFDPRDNSLAELESRIDPFVETDQRMVLARAGRHLVYHSAPFERAVAICGFFRLSVWFEIDRPDTDFKAAIYLIQPDGSSIRLTQAFMRARFRDGLEKPSLVEVGEALCYDFDNFTFVARIAEAGCRLRLVIGPVDSIYFQKNFNNGGSLIDSCAEDALTVKVKLLHDDQHRSALFVPCGQMGGIS